MHLKHSSPSFRLALVTGASSGIGRSLAKLLAQQGVALILVGRDQSRLDQLTSELSNARSIILDLAKPQERCKLIKMIQQEAPELVVNCAGAGLYGHPLQHKTVDFLQLVELNVQALLEISLEAARTLLTCRKRGVVMNVSSIAGLMPVPGSSVYGATKAFVNSFSAAFDFEMRPHGIRILAACPGEVATQFRNAASQGHTSQHSFLAMSDRFAAEQILLQIKKGETLRVFDWRYRLFAFCGRFLFPQKQLFNILSRRAQEWNGAKEFVKTRNDNDNVC